MDFEGLGFVHFQAIYLALVSHVDAWEHGPLHAEVNAILQFSGRMAKLLQPESAYRKVWGLICQWLRHGFAW